MKSMETLIRDAVAMLAERRAQYESATAHQHALFMDEPRICQPLMLSAPLTEAQAAFPAFNHLEMHNHLEKMALNELRAAFRAMNGGREAVPSVRANMGCGIVPSLFGVNPMLFDDKPPWVKNHLAKEQIAEMKVSDLTITPEFQMAIDHMEFMADALKDSGVLVYPVDIQGAFDTAHIVLGDDIFYEMYDDPEFVHHLMDLSCAAIKIAFDESLKRISGSGQSVGHYNSIVMPRALGGIKLSEDTSTLLGKAQLDEFVAPYLHRTLVDAGGGYVHYCGKNPHLYEIVMNDPLAYGLNFGNPDMHDMEKVLADCAAHGMIYNGSLLRNKDESLEVYFKRYLDASTANGRAHLLMSYHCEPRDIATVCATWDRATGI